MGQCQCPGFRQLQAEPFRPLHHQKGSHAQRFLFLLQKQIVGGRRSFQPVEIEMHQRRRTLRVVLRQGEGGAGDRFINAQRGCDALDEGGFASAEGTFQQQQGRPIRLFHQPAAQRAGGLQAL